MITALFHYILKAAVRDRLVWSVVGICAVVVALSIFFGASAVVEQDQFVKSFAAFGVRLFGVAALTLFVITFVRRSFDARDIEFLLSRPIGRVKFVLSHAAAFSFIALVTAFFLGLSVLFFQFGVYHAGFWVWWTSLAVEFIIMVNVAMFFSFVMNSSTACTMIVFAFYLLARLMGEILGILSKSASEGIMLILARIMELISIVIPRLDLMGQTKWLVYNNPPELSVLFLVLQGCVFCALAITATIIDMKRRQF